MKAKLRHFPTNENQQTYTKRNTKGCCSVRRKKIQEGKLKDKYQKV